MDKSNRFDEQIKTFLVTFFFPSARFIQVLISFCLGG